MTSVAYSSETVRSRFVRPVATSRSVVINRTAGIAPSFASGAGNSIGQGLITASRAGSSFSARHPDLDATRREAETGVTSLRTDRFKEKEELRNLNDRFAAYVEKVRFLEAQNKRLVNEINVLRDRWGLETQRIKEMYEVEMEQLKDLLAESNSAKEDLEARQDAYSKQAEEQEEEIKNAYEQQKADEEDLDKLDDQLAIQQGELASLKRKLLNFDSEKMRNKMEIQRLRDEAKRLRSDIDVETMNSINSAQEAQMLRDEIDLIKDNHESKMSELASLAYRDPTEENRATWSNSISKALRDVQADYDEKIDMLKSDLNARYTTRIQEARSEASRGTVDVGPIRDENTRLTTQLNQMRSRVPDLEAKNAQLEALLESLKREKGERDENNNKCLSDIRTDIKETSEELEGVLEEMKNLLNEKLSLEKEILTYKQILDLEEEESNAFDSEELQKKTIENQQSCNPISNGHWEQEDIIESKQADKAECIDSKNTCDLHSEIDTNQDNGDKNDKTKDESDQDVGNDDQKEEGHKEELEGNELHEEENNDTDNLSNQIDDTDKDDALSTKDNAIEEPRLNGGINEGTDSASKPNIGSARALNTRTTKGNISLLECAANGKYIVISNNGSSTEDVSHFTLTKTVDNGRLIETFVFGAGTVLGTEEKSRNLKIWAKGVQPIENENDLEIENSSWGCGSEVLVVLTNAKGEEMATLSQKLIFGE